MMRAGIPLTRALDALASHAGLSMKPLLDSLRAGLRAGHPLSEALARHPKHFPESYVQMVRVAESSGTLAEVLERLHAGRARMGQLRRKIISALTYPAFLVLVALAALVFILTTVIPQLKAAVAASSKQSGAIGGLIGFSDFLIEWKWQLLMLLALLALAIVTALRQRVVREWLALLPGIRNLTQSVLLAEMCRALALLLNNGVTLADALRLTAPILSPRAAGVLMGRMEQALRRGEDFLAPVEGSLILPPLLSNLMRVGVETGKLNQSMEEAALIYEEKLETALERALVLIEPAIIILVSGIVATLVYTVFGALISVNDLVM